MVRKTWVPLFIATSTSDPDSPLITSTLLPPTPRRSDFGTNRSSPTTSEEDYEEFMGPEGLGLSLEATMMSPQLDGTQPTFSSTGAATSGMSNRAAAAAHVRQRSGMAASPSLGVPGSESMERLMSLTSMMDNRGDPDEIRRPSMSKYKAQIYSEKKRVANIIKFVLVFCLSILAIFCVSHLISPQSSTLSRISHSAAYDPTVEHDFDAWLGRVLPTLPSFSNIISLPTLETVPYPLSSHPRTPRDGDSVTLTDYLDTRLGSHFSVPASRTPSHLWYTSANNASIRLSAPHLRSFISTLDADAEWKNAATRGQSREPKRDLIILCLDDGCMEYCRGTDWFCYGGFAIGDKSLKGERLSKAREMVKMMAAIETLRSGRRLFMVDGDVYFRDDPLAHMGKLERYDMQITDAWSSSHTKAGFIYLNPTQSVISLWTRLLELARIDDDHESRLWATTNLLLDPHGASRGFRNKESFSGTTIVDKDGKESKKAKAKDAPDGYGQIEFTSPWNNGTLVKILDKKLFKESTGKVVEDHSFLKEQVGKAIYFQCMCCEDAASANFIAGSLGYHQASVAFPAPAHSTGIPDFPMMITTPTLNGSSSSLAFAASLMLKLASDTNRVFVPPLQTRLITKSSRKPYRDRYIWRLFPVARWAASSGAKAKVVEPHYVQHAKQYLKNNFIHLSGATTKLDELSETLWIDLEDTKTYKDLILTITRPFYSTTRVVTIENFDAALARKKGWEEVQEEKVDLCWEGDSDDADEEEECGQMCRTRPSHYA